MSDGELRRKLQDLGEDVGPITDTTRVVLQRRLQRLLSKAKQERRIPRLPRAAARPCSPQVVRAGTKRPRTPVQAKPGSPAVRQRGSARKRPRLDLQHSPLQAKQPKLYPSLSEFLPESPLSVLRRPSPPPHKPQPTVLSSPLNNGPCVREQVDQHRPHPADSRPRLLHVEQLDQHRPRPSGSRPHLHVGQLDLHRPHPPASTARLHVEQLDQHNPDYRPHPRLEQAAGHHSSHLATPSPRVPYRDNPSSDSGIPSPAVESSDGYSSASSRSPSPEVSPPSSPVHNHRPPDHPLASSPKPEQEKGGFIQTITKLIGGVNKFFNSHSPSPRRSLKPSFDAGSPVRKRNGDGRSQGNASRLQPVNLARIIEENASMEMGEASSLSSENSGFISQSPSPVLASSLSSKSYDWELDPTDVSLCKKGDGSLWRLGKGGFGEVFKGLRDGVDEVAVKIIRINSCSPRTIAEFKAEIDLISKLRHRHIVQFYGACVQPQNLYMVTELMSSDLFSVLRLPRRAERYKWSGIHGKEVLVGVATGLNYLHSRKPAVVHRDIKSPNILVMDGLAKIADVGVARTMGTSDMTAQKGFTIAWAAPEVVYRRRATEKIDIWSLGIILWEVVTGKLPRPGKLVLPDHSPKPLHTLYTLCISDNPSDRPSAMDIITRLKNMHE